jgi:hypothetical protein
MLGHLLIKRCVDIFGGQNYGQWMADKLKAARAELYDFLETKD